MVQPTRAQREQWEAEGYLVLENAIAGEELTRLQETFDRCSAQVKPAWLEGIQTGERPASHFDIPRPLEMDDLFIDLVDHPAWYRLLMAFAGGDLIFLAPQVRTLPPSPVSYVGWHPDVRHDTPLHMKVQIYVDDVPADRGPFAYVPGSHKPDASCPFVQRLEDMPGHKAFPGKAGTAILFNSYGWHTSMYNRTPVPRKSIILIYEKWSEGRVGPDKFAPISEKLTTPARRKLFSLER